MSWTTIREPEKEALVADIMDIMQQAEKAGELEVPHTVIINAIRGTRMRGRYSLKSGRRWRGFTNSLDYRDKSYNQEEFLTEIAGLKMRRVKKADGCILKTLYSL